MAKRSKRYSIYDAMEEAGVFEANPANSYSRDNDSQTLYKGPVQYPKMFYHPTGEERVLNPGSTELINGQYVVVGRLLETIWEIANDSADEKRLRADGWHDHPAKALAAAGRKAPAVSSAARMSELKAKIAEMQTELDQANEAEVLDAGSVVKSKVVGTAKSLGVA